MDSPEQIFKDLNSKPFLLKRFIREHKAGILGTLAFHMLILIVFLSMEINRYQKISELDIVFEYPETKPEPTEEEKRDEERQERFEQLLDQQMRESNRAVNMSKLEEEISTEKYVQEIESELESERSEDWLRQQEELKDIIEKGELVPVKEDLVYEDDKPEFTGPTNIEYRFLEEPINRTTVHLPVPVYKCKGYGTVDVLVTVNNSGTVTSARATLTSASEDPECLREVAERYANRTVFRGDLNAPKNHEAIITYNFIAQ